MKNQNEIRREYRFEMVNNLSQMLERFMRKHNLSDCDFSRIMSRSFKTEYPNWPGVKKNLQTMMNGRRISDTFAAKVRDMIATITSDPSICDRVLGKKRVGWRERNVGQSVEYREEVMSSNGAFGEAYVARFMRKAMK